MSWYDPEPRIEPPPEKPRLEHYCEKCGERLTMNDYQWWIYGEDICEKCYEEELAKEG